MKRNGKLIAKFAIIAISLTGVTTLFGTQTASAAGTLKCSPTSAAPHTPMYVAVPTSKPPLVDRVITLNTNCGQIVFEALGKQAPITVQMMTALARAGYFDESLCHRLVTAGIFVLQCGDPTASGADGPWSANPKFKVYKDENLPKAVLNNYPAGTVAMANAGPNTNGSQFFIVYKDTTLKPVYTRWGVVLKGLDIIQALAADGVDDGSTDGRPAQPIAIESVSVR